MEHVGAVTRRGWGSVGVGGGVGVGADDGLSCLEHRQSVTAATTEASSFNLKG